MLKEIDKTDPNDQLGCCPYKVHWELRRNQFRQLELVAMGDHGWASHNQVEPMIRELEHVFCAGGWLAAVVFSQAIVEISMGLYGFETAKDRENFLKQFDLDEKAKWLRERRNTLVHRKGSQIETVSLEEVTNYREKLRYDAKAAV